MILALEILIIWFLTSILFGTVTGMGYQIRDGRMTQIARSVLEKLAEHGVERCHKPRIGLRLLAIAGIDLDHGPAFAAAVKRMPPEPLEMLPRYVSAIRAGHRNGDVGGWIFHFKTATDRMAICIVLALWLVLSIPVAAFIGRGIKFGMKT